MKSSTQITLLAVGLSVVGAGAMTAAVRYPSQDACRNLTPEMIARTTPLTDDQTRLVDACLRQRSSGSSSHSSHNHWYWSSNSSSYGESSGSSGSSGSNGSSASSASLKSGGSASSSSTTHVSTGGFGSTGSFHFSGGS